MTLQVCKNKLENEVSVIESFNNYIKGNQSFSTEISSIGKQWWRISIKNKDDCQIGRISYHFDEEGNVIEIFPKYYKKHFMKYSVQDKMFFMIDYYLKTGKILTDIEQVIDKAKKIQDEVFQERIEFVKNNPKFKKNKDGEIVRRKRKCERKSLRNLISSLVSERINECLK